MAGKWQELLNRIQKEVKGIRPQAKEYKGLSGPEKVGQAASDIGMWSDLAASISQQKQEEEAAAAARSGGGGGEGDESYEDYWNKQGYRRRRADDGGWNFYDPEGNLITAAKYGTALQMPLNTAISGSMNPDDLAFIQEHNDLMEDYSKALSNDYQNPYMIIKEGKYEEEKKVPVDFHKDILQPMYDKYSHVFGAYGERREKLREEPEYFRFSQE